jgi:hypothetical protein
LSEIFSGYNYGGRSLLKGEARGRSPESKKRER